MTLPKRILLIAALASASFALPMGKASSQPAVTHIGRDHYTGTWLEIARRPMWITDGCVAGFTTYKPSASPDIIRVEDGCRVGSPKGNLKTISGVGKLEDFGSTNAKLTVRYPLFITFRYWVRYEAPDKSWFISADPEMENLWIYARKVPSKSAIATMVTKAKSLGYDVEKLEFPAQ